MYTSLLIQIAQNKILFIKMLHSVAVNQYDKINNTNLPNQISCGLFGPVTSAMMSPNLYKWRHAGWRPPKHLSAMLLRMKKNKEQTNE